MGYEDNMAYFTSKWTSDIVFRDNDSVCNDFSCAIGMVGWRKILDLLGRLTKVCKFCVAGAI